MNLTGKWIGETQGKNTRAHDWLIQQTGSNVQISHRWVGDHSYSATPFIAEILPNNEIRIRAGSGIIARIRDVNTFIVPRWVGGQYDVVFRRQH